MIKEFKEFILRGNVLDLAVGIIVGAAFGKIVSSFVADILMPPLGLMMGKTDFSNLFLTLAGPTGMHTLAEAKQAGAVTLNYGLFINAVIDFLIVGFAIFLVVKASNKLRHAPPKDANIKKCPECLSSIPKPATKCAFCTSAVSAT